VSTPSSSFTELVLWLARNANFPRSRLPDASERLLLLSAAASDADAAAAVAAGPGGVQRRDNAKDAAMRAHAMRRSLVHYRCDNGAKV
jgi:hypothetical protein